ncbi:MAG TPA: glycosyltransferase [Candidatus Dormibacteraeota bacterium]|nr:glycosyltransferase [Candidatus Dormibacteraeota bacterium]
MTTAARDKPAALAWARFQPRTVALARALGGDPIFVPGSVGRRLTPAPIRYLAATLHSWKSLDQKRPSYVVVITPPVVAPLMAYLWCRLRRRPLVVDCHTDAFHSRRWRWARMLHRWLLCRSRAALVHTEEALALVRSWGAPGLLLPDDLPEPSQAEPRPHAARPTVLVAGSLDPSEPTGEVMGAAALLPEVEFRLTGDPQQLPASVRDRIPPNVVLTGFLPYATFLGEMLAADVVAAFSTDPHIMNRAAFEAVGLGRALVLSDIDGLRRRFGTAALFSANRPAAMADALGQALFQRVALEEQSRRLAQDLRRQHSSALDRLRAMLLSQRSISGGHTRVLRITQHPFPADSVVRRDVIDLTAHGYDVDVVCAAGPDRDDVVADSPSLRIYRIPISHRRGRAIRYPLEYLAFFLGAFGLAAALGSRRRYATVQVDNLPDFLVFAAAIPRLRGARVILTLYELTPEMVAARFTGRLRRFLVWLARLVERAAVHWADHLIVVSEPCRSRLLARNVPGDRMSVVLNTTPWDCPRPAQLRQHSSSPVLITHTTLLERYGVHVAIEAVGLLKTTWPDLTLRVVGGGEEHSRLVRLTHELRLHDRVIFTGQLPWSETLAEVSRATLGIVAILADGYGELLLPTKLLEYAWLGIPAVCSRLPAIGAYFPADAVAYAAPGEARDVARQVDRLLRQPELARRQAERASEIARDLSWEHFRDAYISALGLAEMSDSSRAGVSSSPAGGESVGIPSR